MGKESSRTLREDGFGLLRDYKIPVSGAWLREIDRKREELLNFRLMMLQLQTSHPDTWELCKNIYRAIDMRRKGCNNSPKVDNQDNGVTNS